MRDDPAHSARHYTVSQVARLSGVSVRALHHYDEIGLLKPVAVGTNGYRYYGRQDLLRLQQILFHRELGMPLAEIGAILDAPGFDRLDALRAQRARVEAEAERQRQLLETIDRTIADLEGDTAVTEKHLFEGFGSERQAEYEDWLIDKLGEDARPRIRRSAALFADMDVHEKSARLQEFERIAHDLADRMRRGVAADDTQLDPLLREHHAWIWQAWGTRPTAAAYAGLGELYASAHDFASRFDACSPGMSAWMREAMKAYSQRAL
ncbi:MerR family transcriptional regulator [Uliginosibacterium sp. H1]|uniref:MerR family transcriptional regulator n=1 Tax=Uliginosibacterium sp. H1 TaxID=3114757 RepID=UPI002E197FBC|nr:MerR family transcriptional regulator [Uliginosibacterium sp. H1]